MRFSIALSEEQKRAKAKILNHPFNFIVGKAGSGKTLLAVQIALDQFFKRQFNQIIITRPTVATEDNGFLTPTKKTKVSKVLKAYEEAIKSMRNEKYMSFCYCSNYEKIKEF